MKFDDFDNKMRQYEKSIEQIIPADYYIVARLDGKGFTKLTKEDNTLKRPFDDKFKDCMVKTVCHLMNCGFHIVYAYSESDEISLLFDKSENKFNRKTRKYNSILASEASVIFSAEFNKHAIFDCRIIPLPTKESVQDYFLWRQEDCHRNSIYAHCYYKLLENGYTPLNATEELKAKFLNEKCDMLADYNVDINKIPLWQIWGWGAYYKTIEKTGFNPKLLKEEITTRSKLFVDEYLPQNEEYSKMILQFCK